MIRVFVLLFCLLSLSIYAQEHACDVVKNGGPAEAALYAGAQDLIQNKGVFWLPENNSACAAVKTGWVAFLTDQNAWSVAFADDGDCSANVFLNPDLTVKGYGLVGCY